MKVSLPQEIMEMTSKYLPAFAKFEVTALRESRQRIAAIQVSKRRALDRLMEEELLEQARRQRLKLYLLARKQTSNQVGVVSLWRQRWSEYRGRATFEPSVHFPDVVDDTLEWINQSDVQKTEKISKEAGTPMQGFTKPDPFIVSAPMYKEGSGSRLVCRKCDHTLSRGVRGVHLFSWYDNYHLALNEELADTICYKEISDPIELKKSPWKRGKVACPCCGSSVGSLGVANGRMKVMFKGVNVAWRKSGEAGQVLPKQVTHSKVIPSARPLGASLPASWLLHNAGLMTHNRRWVLDSTVLHTLLAVTGEASAANAAEKPPATFGDSDQTNETLVRTSDKEPAQIHDSLKRIAIRSAAFENIVMLQPSPSLKGIAEVANFYESAISRQGDSGPNPPYDQSSACSKAFVRFQLLSKLAQIAADTERTAAVSALLKTPKFAEMMKKCIGYLKPGHEVIDHIPARTLCSAARLLSHDQSAIQSVVRILAARKTEFGPTAGAFGRSAEYLKSALAQAGCNEADIAEAMGKASSLHPTPGGRFGEELEPSGFVELFCTHGTGLECNRRATHAPPTPSQQQNSSGVRGDSRVGRIPLYCRSHAPLGYVATMEGYRGVIPPSEDPMRQRSHMGYYPAQHSGHSHYQPWHRRGRNSIAEIPDEGMTEPLSPEPGTLYLGKEWEDQVKVIYEMKKLEEASAYLDQLIVKAEELMASHPQQVPSSSCAVSLDAEWKPEFVYDENNRLCSIIQLATRDRTFVFDAIGLGAALDPIMKKLLKSKAIMKIGHGLSEDFARIAQGLSRAAGHADKYQEYFPIESVVELSDLFCKAEDRVYRNGARPSLVTMVDAATGTRLDKRCQMTDWERRPLSPAQVRYAATDAACGLVMFDYFSQKIAQAAGLSEINIAEYLQKDEGLTSPQRAMAADARAAAVTSSDASGAIAPAATSSRVYPSYPGYIAPPPHRPYAHPGHFQVPHGYVHPGGARLGGMMGRGVTRIGPTHFSRLPGRKILSKYELRRVRELKHDLMSRGVRVDEHAKLEGLEVASEHLQKSLSRVVRDSLVDPPTASPSPSGNQSGNGTQSNR